MQRWTVYEYIKSGAEVEAMPHPDLGGDWFVREFGAYDCRIVPRGYFNENYRAVQSYSNPKQWSQEELLAIIQRACPKFQPNRIKPTAPGHAVATLRNELEAVLQEYEIRADTAYIVAQTTPRSAKRDEAQRLVKLLQIRIASIKDALTR